MNDVTQESGRVSQGTEQSNNLVYQNTGGALSRTGTACESEVPLGVGNSLGAEVTYRCNMVKKNCPPDRLSAWSLSLGYRSLANILYEVKCPEWLGRSLQDEDKTGHSNVGFTLD